MNGVLKNRIVKICQHTGLNWIAALPLALMVCRSSELRDLRITPHELVTGRRMPTPCLRTSGKGPSLALLEDEMRAYVTYMANFHKKLSTYVSDSQRKEEVQEKLDEQKRSTVQPGDKVFVKVFRRKWYNERREGPFEVVRSTGTAVQVKGSPTWYHLSHCVKAPSEEVPRVDSQDGEGSRELDDNREEQAEGEMHDNIQNQNPEGDIVHSVDNVGNHVHTFDDARYDSAIDGEERRVGDIGFQYVPESAGPILVEGEVAEVTKGCISVTGEASVPLRQNSPRPVRKRVRPKRYENVTEEGSYMEGIWV
ncbi:uncharacterized protein LOC119892521 [Micropterus salmoides]|uniref:uncharacterized protein LOC119892521 n=1 Tax=Micropterus salmoides TaxID=27706 RepID=UPI0018ED2120|nr:uncharacterized protein LOC119892521 [Micropterus salmoides]